MPYNNPYYTDVNIPFGSAQNQNYSNNFNQGRGYGSAQNQNFSRNFNPYDTSGVEPKQGGGNFGDIAGGIGQGLTGLTTGIGQSIDTHQQLQGQVDYWNDKKFTNAETMVGGVPSYSGVSKIGQEVGAIDLDSANRGMGLTGFKGGAAAGASIGGAVGAGVGLATGGAISAPLGAIGAGVGAVAGGITGWIKGMTKKGKADKAAYEALQKGRKQFTASQNEYNEDVGTYYDEVDANRQNIQQERGYANRLYGLGGYNDPFKSII